MNPAHRAFVNHEVFFFSSPALRKLFLGDPLRWCGVLTDPVSGLRFQPDKTAPKAAYEGRTYYFSSADTLAMFQMDPPMYRDAKRAMPPPAPAPPASSPQAPPESAPPPP
jgi:YHS domain-containing protein